MKARIFAIALALGLSLMALNATPASAIKICGYDCPIDPDGFCTCQWYYCRGYLTCGQPFS